MKNIMIVILGLSLFLSTEVSITKECKKGKPCGNTCIAKDKVCKSDFK